MKRTIVIALILLTVSIFTFAVGVEPMSVEIEANAGTTAEFDLTIRGEAEDVITKITPFQPLQTKNGEITYQKVDAEAYSPIGWIELPQEEFDIPAGDQVDIPVRVNIPFGVRGTHILTLMVEPEGAQGEGMIQFKIRYAIRVTIRVNAAGMRENAKVEQIDFVPGDKNEPVVQATLTNTSGLDYIASLNAAIRDEKGRLIENIELLTESERKRGKQGIRFYPDSTLIFRGTPEKIIKPGTYRIQLVSKMNDFQRIFQEYREISEKQFDFPDAEDYYLVFDETKKIIKTKPGSVQTEVIQVKNEGPQQVDVQLSFTDIFKNFNQTIKPYVKFRGKSQFTLGQGRSNRLVSMFKVPRESTPNTYYGKLTYTASKEGTPIVQKDVILALQVGDPKPTEATMTGISSNREVVSAIYENTGEIHLDDLMGEVTVLRKETMDMIESIDLNPVKTGWIFPTEEFTLLGQAESPLPTGTVVYRTKLYQGKELLVESEMDGVIQ